jgi:uncharacterized protein YdiU (UPF0061 family)
LPTEAEWEAAAQGTNNRAIFTWGDNPTILNSNANTWQGVFPTKNESIDGFKLIAPVKSYPANSIGIYDMAGNVWELTADLFNVNHYKELDISKPIKNPKGANKSYCASTMLPLDLHVLSLESSLLLIEKAFYDFENISNEVKDNWNLWFKKYANRLQKEFISSEERKQKMDTVNPKYVLRNYMSQMAIDEADKGNYTLIDELFQLLKKPYETQPEQEKWFSKRPEWARNKIGCSMLSCSS